MGYLKSDDDELIETTVREFATTVVDLEAAHERDRHDAFPKDVLTAASELGLASMGLREVEGGPGISLIAYALALKQIAQVEPSTATLLAVHNGMGLRLLTSASETLREEILPEITAGAYCGYLATEEAGGIDKANMSTLATKTEDGWSIQGSKVWGLGAEGAKHYLVLATVADAGPTWFRVAADLPGVSLGRNEPLMGLRAAGIRSVYFDDVAIRDVDQVGELGGGLELHQAALPFLQLGVAATILGAIRGAHGSAIDFAANRVQFGQPIAMFQAVSMHLTEIEVQCRALEALVLESAGKLQADHPDASLACAAAKAFADHIAAPMTRRALRVQGGTGFMREGGTERFARDVRCLYFVGEPPIVAHDRIKRALLDLPFGAAP